MSLFTLASDVFAYNISRKHTSDENVNILTAHLGVTRFIFFASD